MAHKVLGSLLASERDTIFGWRRRLGQQNEMLAGPDVFCHGAHNGAVRWCLGLCGFGWGKGERVRSELHRQQVAGAWAGRIQALLSPSITLATSNPSCIPARGAQGTQISPGAARGHPHPRWGKAGINPYIRQGEVANKQAAITKGSPTAWWWRWRRSEELSPSSSRIRLALGAWEDWQRGDESARGAARSRSQVPTQRRCKTFFPLKQGNPRISRALALP